MKALILLLAILAGVWLWRSGRQRRTDAQANARPSPAPDPRKPAPMVACAVCGVHMPAADAVTGHRGAYCCTAHHRQAEG